jgi:hypothetical protein
VETAQSGMVRSEIAAYVLRSRMHLLQGEIPAARSMAQDALRLLDRVGDMPALRSEEVRYHAACALRADGAASEAEDLLARARTEVMRKAGHIDEPGARDRYLREVPLNRKILGDQP